VSLQIASRIAWSVIGAVAVFMVFNMFYPQYREYQHLQETLRALEEECALYEEEIKLYREKQARLEVDPEFVKQTAQETLGFVPRGETVIQFGNGRQAGIPTAP
jgi:cell division protein FtsB